MSDARTFLAARTQDGLAVTYGLLSRALRMHVDAAREAMRAFADETRGKGGAPYAVYTVRGVATDAEVLGAAPIESIVVVGADDLPDTLKRFKEPIHDIYALQPQKTLDLPLLAAVNQETMHKPELLAAWEEMGSQLGVIVGSERRSAAAIPLGSEQRAPRPAKSTVPAAAAPPPRVKDETPGGPAQPPSEPAAAPPAGVKAEPAPAGTRRVRKKRKVIRKEKTKNEKGYTVTRDVEAYESYSEDEPEEEHKPAAPAAEPKRAAPSGGHGPSPQKHKQGRQGASGPKQPSLTSFFGKSSR